MGKEKAVKLDTYRMGGEWAEWKPHLSQDIFGVALTFRIMLMFYMLKLNQQRCLPNDCPVLHSHQQCMKYVCQGGGMDRKGA